MNHRVQGPEFVSGEIQIDIGGTHIVESTRVLGDDIERSAQRAECASVQTVAVCCAVHIRSCRMNSGVDHEGRGVEHPVRTTCNDLSGMIDLDQVRCFH